MGAELSDEQLDDFGDVEYILDRIMKELNVQFNTHKQLILKTLYAYISNSKALDDLNCFSMFGTNSFNLVWEKVCAEVLDNQLQKPIGALKLPMPLKGKYHEFRHNKLIELIEKPIWRSVAPSGAIFEKQADDTLIPDIISITYINNDCFFVIFDAKYYNLQLEHNKKLRGQPGIESVTKQYLYQLAYQEFADSNGIKNIRNCFLLPTEEVNIVDKGTAVLPMLQSLGLQDIQLRLLPSNIMYKHYVSNTKLDIKDLML